MHAPLNVSSDSFTHSFHSVSQSVTRDVSQNQNWFVLLSPSVCFDDMIRRKLASQIIPESRLGRFARLPGLDGKRLFSSESAGSRTSILYPLLGGVGLATAGATKYVHDHVGGTEGLTRSLSFYRYE
jgi:hypothetical protein